MTATTKKIIKIDGTESIVNKLIIAAKSVTCDKWERLQEDLCSGMSLQREDRVMDRVAKSFGINPIEYNNEPYGTFIDNIWREAHGYSITVNTDC